MDDTADGDPPGATDQSKARRTEAPADTSLREPVVEAIPTVTPHPSRSLSQSPPWPEDAATPDFAGEAADLEARAVVEPAEVASARAETEVLAPPPVDAAGDTAHAPSPASVPDASEPETGAAISADVPEPPVPAAADAGDSAPPALAEPFSEHGAAEGEPAAPDFAAAPDPDRILDELTVAPAPGLGETPPVVEDAASHALADETSAEPLPASHVHSDVHAEPGAAIFPASEPDLAATDPDRIPGEPSVAPPSVPDEMPLAIDDAASRAIAGGASAESPPGSQVHQDLHAARDVEISPASGPDLATAWWSAPPAAPESLAQSEADVSPSATRDRHVAAIDEHHVWSSAAHIASSVRSPESNPTDAARYPSLAAGRHIEEPISAAPHVAPEAIFAAAHVSSPSAPDPRVPASSWPATSPLSHGSRRTAVDRIRSAAGIAGVVVLALAATVLLLVVLYRWVDPPASTLMIGQRLTGTEIEQRWVPIERISPHLLQAVILSEDGAFCRHNGVDWAAMEEAIESSRGGSTITMQVVKNLFLWPQRSYIRKALEIMLAYVVEMVWSKERILEIYLNIAEWGPGVFGAEAAARNHFNKAASRLTAQEAALLAVSLPSPIERQAGHPGWQTRRLADNLLLRMRAVRTAQRCVRVRRGG